MARFPCSLDGARFQGPASYVYPTVLENGNRWFAKLRLCPTCAAEVREYITRYGIVWDERTPVTTDSPQFCPECEKSIDRQDPRLYVTAYWRADERWDCACGMHVDCALTLAGRWELSGEA